MEPNLNIDFQSILAVREKELQSRIEWMRSQGEQLKMIPFCTFSVGEIPELATTSKSSSEWSPPQMCFDEQHQRKPFVYVFQLADPAQKAAVLKKFEEVRAYNATRKEGKIALPKLPKEAFQNASDILYVGSVKKDFHYRIKAHLGHGANSTSAMQLKRWAPKELRLHLYVVQVAEKKMTEEIEAAIAAHLKPLIGKSHI